MSAPPIVTLASSARLMNQHPDCRDFPVPEPEERMRVLITGSRYWDDTDTIEAWLRHIGPCLVIHGAARGADMIAHNLARKLGYGVEAHHADWTKGKRAGPERNQRMVDSGADLCLGFPMQGSRGTIDCMRRAAAAGIRVIVIRPGQYPGLRRTSE